LKLSSHLIFHLDLLHGEFHKMTFLPIDFFYV
jgi:hypothetical protein